MANDYTYKLLVEIVGKTVADAQTFATNLGVTTQVVVEDGVRLLPDDPTKANLTVDAGVVTSYIF